MTINASKIIKHKTLRNFENKKGKFDTAWKYVNKINKILPQFTETFVNVAVGSKKNNYFVKQKFTLDDKTNLLLC